MISDSEPDPIPPDYGKVVKARRARISWAWLFPVLAASAAAWLFWTNWKGQGPEIQIYFADAPGIHAGKSLLIYRGVTAGHVTRVFLNDPLDGVIVTVRLNAFAAGLARAESAFWIDQPVISLRETTGLESLIQGNSIHARLGGGEVATKFTGLSEAPLSPLDTPSLLIQLRAASIDFLDRGTPIYHGGVTVGVVREKSLDSSGDALLLVAIDHQHKGFVRNTSKFWIVPATSLKISTTGATIDIASLSALVQGGIAFDEFGSPGEPSKDQDRFLLAPNEFAARADSSAITISFDDGRGIVPGQTVLTYLGQPIGLVDRVQVKPSDKTVDAIVKLQAAFAGLVKADSIFTVVSPRISLDGISGLDTLVSGAYIAFEPGSSDALADHFIGRSESDEEWARADAARDGLQVRLSAEDLPTISEGAPVFYRGLVAGRVLKKLLDENDRPILEILVNREFRDALRTNSRFWRVPATSISAGPGVVDVEIEGLVALVQGGVTFDIFDEPGNPATEADIFQLYNNQTLAAATSAPVKISFKLGRGLLAGKSELRYLGVPVGVVEQIYPKDGAVEVVARFRPGHDQLRRNGTTFAIVEPVISLQGVTGIETLLSGVYIQCIPGTENGYTDSFVGVTTSDPHILQEEGFELQLTAAETGIQPGAQVVYRSTEVGEVFGKKISKDGQRVILDIRIDTEYQHLVRDNSRFWDASTLEASIGFIKLKIKTGAVLGPAGKIAFASPEMAGGQAAEGSIFELYETSQEKALRRLRDKQSLFRTSVDESRRDVPENKVPTFDGGK